MEGYKTEFRTWFYDVECLAWKWVNTYPERERPDRIFGIWGQYLTNEYSIAHQQGTSSECEILVNSSFGISQTTQVSALMGHRCQYASASAGFTEYRGGDDLTKYSIFLQVMESFPMNFIPYERKRSVRIDNAFKSSFTSLNRVNCGRFFQKLSEKNGNLPSGRPQAQEPTGNNSHSTVPAPRNQLNFQSQRRVPMQPEPCIWYLLKLDDGEFAVTNPRAISHYCRSRTSPIY